SMTGGHVDLERGLIYRKSAAETETNKRAPTVRLPRKLLNHLRRWRGTTRRWLVEWDGKPIQSLKRTWKAARARAGLDAAVTPHVLRHTAITWAMQAGARPADVCSFFGVTMRVVETVYWHHSPDAQASVLDHLNRPQSGA
ncbi:MAG: tyrosine-type recombinase/integrase, partial [Pseudomonadota bacterium]